jgi:hypothetical protein
MYLTVSSSSENQALRGHLADGSFRRVPPCSGKFGGKSGGKHAHLAWETCHKSMVLTAYRAFDDAFVCYLPRGQPSQRHNPGNPPRSAKTERHKRENQEGDGNLSENMRITSISAGCDGVTDPGLRPRLRCWRRGTPPGSRQAATISRACRAAATGGQPIRSARRARRRTFRRHSEGLATHPWGGWAR